MTDKKTEALKLALEAICGSGDFLFNWHDCEPNNEREMQRYQATLADNEKAFKAIKEALAEQPAQKRPQNCGTGYCSCIECVMEQPAQQQEPVAWVCEGSSSDEKHAIDYWPGDVDDLPIGTKLYTSPQPSKPWVGLTDEEMIDCERLADIRHRKHMGSIRGQQLSPADQFLWHYARAIETKLREKNA